ncbi:MAG: dihydrofolate reductase family protein [Rubrobacter sp.]|nr:dihydrofolate reductase family protein [Rubrobacter sp.]
MPPPPPEGLRLYPPPCERVPEIYGDISLPDRNPRDGDLPFVFLNAVGTLDGGAAISGKAGKIGGSADREVMRVLRSQADAVLVGAGTLRAERMSLGSEGRRSPEPLAIIITSTGDVPLENLLDPAPERTVVLLPGSSTAGRAGSISGKARTIPLPPDPSGKIELRTALLALRERLGVSRVLIEGGPKLFGEAISRGLAGELFLTVAPKISMEPQDRFRRIVEPSGAPPGPIRCTLISVHYSEEELFLRYSL